MKYLKSNSVQYSGATLPGINVQYPVSKFILEGRKIVETRTYPLPKKYTNQDLFFVETPGPSGDFKARIAGIIRFARSVCYSSKDEFYADVMRHLITPESEWRWIGKPKWGWEIARLVHFRDPVTCNMKRRGIVFTKTLHLP